MELDCGIWDLDHIFSTLIVSRGENHSLGFKKEGEVVEPQRIISWDSDILNYCFSQISPGERIKSTVKANRQCGQENLTDLCQVFHPDAHWRYA